MLHPKLIKLEEVILEHFKKFGKGKRPTSCPNRVVRNLKDNFWLSWTDETRVMIFSQYRESVYEITSVLAAHSDIIKPMEFVGQSSNGSRKTVTQKEQLAVSRVQIVCWSAIRLVKHFEIGRWSKNSEKAASIRSCPLVSVKKV